MKEAKAGMKEYSLFGGRLKVTIKSAEVAMEELKRNYIGTGHYDVGLHVGYGSHEFRFIPHSLSRFLVPPSWKIEREVYLQQTGL